MNATANQLIIENDGRHDPFGAAMSLAFDVCEALAYRGADIPFEWDYRMGAGGIDTDSLNPSLDTSNNAELVGIGNHCLAVVEACRAKGLDY